MSRAPDPATHQIPILPGSFIEALYELQGEGQQFYMLPTANSWLFFYNGQVKVH